jgi:hypothetical protein
MTRMMRINRPDLSLTGCYESRNTYNYKRGYNDLQVTASCRPQREWRRSIRPMVQALSCRSSQTTGNAVGVYKDRAENRPYLVNEQEKMSVAGIKMRWKVKLVSQVTLQSDATYLLCLMRIYDQSGCCIYAHIRGTADGQLCVPYRGSFWGKVHLAHRVGVVLAVSV